MEYNPYIIYPIAIVVLIVLIVLFVKNQADRKRYEKEENNPVTKPDKHKDNL